MPNICRKNQLIDQKGIQSKCYIDQKEEFFYKIDYAQ